MPSSAQAGLQGAQAGSLQPGRHVWKPGCSRMLSSCIAHRRFVSRGRTSLAGHNRHPPLHTGWVAAGLQQTCAATGLEDQARCVSLISGDSLVLDPCGSVSAQPPMTCW